MIGPDTTGGTSIDGQRRPESLLSILIPIYMRNISQLLAELCNEIMCAGLTGAVEILATDDASPDAATRNANRIAAAAHAGIVEYEDLATNLGRAAIRNHLGSKASGRVLLFLDCDVLPDDGAFLRRYLEAFAKGTTVACGGISYRRIGKPEVDERFYLYVSGRNDVKPAASRNRNPAKHLLTGNVAIRRETFTDISFDTSFREHGYEDSEWALRLSNSHQIVHIDNSVTHLGLIRDHAFISRTATATDNYVRLARKNPQLFKRSAIHRFALLTKPIPRSILDISGRLLATLAGRRWMPLLIRYICFQMMKALLFSARARGI